MKYLGVGMLAACVIATISGHTYDSEQIADTSMVPIDTFYADDPFVTRAYNWGKEGKSALTVPFVDLDTNTYEKKFSLNEKKLLSPLVPTKPGWVVAYDSVVFVAFNTRSGINQSFLEVTYSLDYGNSWSAPSVVQEVGSTAGNPSMLIDSKTLSFAYNIIFSPPLLSKLYFRSANLADLDMVTGSPFADSTVVDSVIFLAEYVIRAKLVPWSDTLLLSYIYYHNNTNYFTLRQSADGVSPWSFICTDCFVTASPRSFLLTDTVLSEVYPVVGLDVGIRRSYDHGVNWTEFQYLSDSGSYAGQSPAATTDGVSDLHVIWYDFEGAPGGWGGYVFYRRSLDNGETWLPIRSLSTQPYAERMDIWADINRVYAVWNDSRYGSPDYAIYMRYSHDRGATWSPEIMVVDSIDPAWDPDIHGWEDYVYLVWHEQHPPDWLWGVYYRFGGWYIPGDWDLSESVNIVDLTHLVDYMFAGGNPPPIYDAGQMDGAGGINIIDVTYFVDFLFGSGDPPVGGS